MNFYIDTTDGPRGCALNKNVVTINRGGIVTASKFFSTDTLKVHFHFHSALFCGEIDFNYQIMHPTYA